MEQTQNQNDFQSAFRYFLSQTQVRNNSPKLEITSTEPLGRSEDSINLNERSLSLPLEPEDEEEENIFSDDEPTNEVPTESRNPDPEEQVVPSSQSSHLSLLSQLSDGYKYEETSATDVEEDEGIFEDELTAEDWILVEESRLYDSQPP
ncbi:uncharacterized protein LOC117169007 isoform X2 [Belonocnema kinseyi]|nr:uncharacterized protein LOC117169007 isoform X2 [Belonocnema kinseyi]XP_033210948.1 uncharacterized protein LOC117169007 isoform X2 [Belonocnema kinseyi]XP_033210949.1 uncharacterized protein LOC117169007 isoform X2 [Belonocnema kinseyi]